MLSKPASPARLPLLPLCLRNLSRSRLLWMGWMWGQLGAGHHRRPTHLEAVAAPAERPCGNCGPAQGSAAQPEQEYNVLHSEDFPAASSSTAGAPAAMGRWAGAVGASGGQLRPEDFPSLPGETLARLLGQRAAHDAIAPLSWHSLGQACKQQWTKIAA